VPAASALRDLLWAVARRVEFQAARLTGKGYGAAIEREVDLTRDALKTEPRLALDIGGNAGDYTACLIQRSPGLEVHVFEPAAVNVAKLRARFGTNETITVVPSAVSSLVGETVLYSNAAGSGLGSLTKRRLDHANIPFEHTETISTIRLEDYWRDVLGGRTIDIVKLDVEGHELDVLNSFGDAIRHTSVIQFEFGGTGIDTKVYLQDFWYFFKDAGFDLYRMSPLGLYPMTSYSERDEHFMFANFVAVRR